MASNTKLQQLKSRLERIENQLSTCRTSVMQDGWQTKKYARNARKWDVLARRKMEILTEIFELEEV